MNPSKTSNMTQNLTDDSGIINIDCEKTADEKNAENEVECICLDDSDSEAKDQTISLESPQDDIMILSSVPQEKTDYVPQEKMDYVPQEKMDYLHLDSSDTDDEQESIQNSVNNLLNSAAILNDIECGPPKPSTTNLITADLPQSSNILFNSDLKSTNVRNEKYLSYIDITEDSNSSSKRLKSNSPSISSVTLCETEEKDPRESMYRRDIIIRTLEKEKLISGIPSELHYTFKSHEKSVSSLGWCAVPYSHLLLSSSLDSTVKLWDIYSHERPLNTFKLDLPVRAAVWSKTGEQVIAGGFGKKAHVFDALSGKNNLFCFFI
ncbi:hypothetical protein TNCV_3791571 [Trichonephila clavipes]|nr:hypothetical protein TNCV_3791571 [Trichonephila clavipes]